MERYTMFIDLKKQYCQNDCTLQGNLQIQCNPYQITNGILHRIRTKNFIIYMGIQKTQRAEAILRETEQKKSGSLTSEYTAKLQKQKYKSAEQDRKPRNNPTQLWSINQRQRR